MKKIIKKVNRALQAILMAPIKLPKKIVAVLRYLAVAVGIVENVMEDRDETP